MKYISIGEGGEVYRITDKESKTLDKLLEKYDLNSDSYYTTDQLSDINKYLDVLKSKHKVVLKLHNAYLYY